MARKILKTAVAGLGRIAWSDHLPGLLRHPDCFQVSAVVDPLPERRADTCGRFRIPVAFASLEELLEQQRPDLVVIASPTPFHAQQTILALKHGCHVFCDKPAAMTLEEAQKMHAAAQASGRLLTVYQPRRFNADSAALKVLLQSEKLGTIYQIKLYVGNYSPRTDWQAFRKNGGGMLRNYGAHALDQCCFLLGGKLRLLACVTDRIISLGDAEDVVKILLCSDRGILVDLDINQASALQPYRWCVYGSRGCAVARGLSNDWEIRFCDPVEGKTLSADDTMAARERKYSSLDISFRSETFRPEIPEKSPIDFYLRNLADSIAGKTEVVVPFQETLEVMRLMDECRAAARKESSRVPERRQP